MDIHEYFKIKAYLEDQREAVREVILHDVLLNPENYHPDVVQGLSGTCALRVRPDYDEEDTPFVVEMMGNGSIQVIPVPEHVMSGVQMSWGKEKEIEEYVTLFETHAFGKIYGKLTRREILTPDEQEKFFAKTAEGKRVFGELHLDCEELTQAGARFRMRNFDANSDGEDFIFYVDPQLLATISDMPSWKYWDEISRY